MAEFNRNDIKKYGQRQATDPRYQTLGRRVYAGMVDNVFYALFGLIVTFLLQWVEVSLRYPIYRFAFLPFFLLFPIIFTKVFGGTPGKLYFHLQVLPKNEEGRITWGQSIRRELLNLLTNLLDLAPVFVFYIWMAQTSYADYLEYSKTSLWYTIFSVLALTIYIIELLTAARSPQRRSVHDQIAGTVVVITGPYRPWSNFVAIGGFVGSIALAFFTFPFNHN